MKNIIVLSHRRSGTHLTIDSIINNFKDYQKHDYINIDSTKDGFEKQISTEKFDDKINKKIRVIKSHFLPNFEFYYKDEKDADYVENLFENSHVIYVYRNGLDVMVSLFEYMKAYDKEIAKMDFNDFIKTKNNFDPEISNLDRIDSWKHHIKSWQESRFADKILFVKFEDLISDFEETISTISKKIGAKPDEKIVDIRLKKSNNNILRPFYNLSKKIKGIKKTSVSARKGKIGGYKNYFNEENLKLFMEKNGEFMKKIGY